MQSRKLVILSFAVAAVVFAITMNASAATHAAAVALDHANFLSFLLHDQLGVQAMRSTMTSRRVPASPTTLPTTSGKDQNQRAPSLAFHQAAY